MADTISSNIAILRDMLRNTDEPKIIREVEKMDEVVKMFINRSELPVTNSDVHRLLKYAITDDDEETDETFDKMENLGMLLYVMGSHQKQLRLLIRNPREYIRKCQELPAKHDFKLNPNLKSLKNWWDSEMVMTQSKSTAITSSHRRNLLVDLGSDTDSDEESAKAKKKKGKKKPQKPPSPSSSLVSSSDDQPPPQKKPAQKRKQPQLELSAIPAIKLSSGVSVLTVDFSDPQGGKGAADHMSATCKNRIRRYINKGHEVTTAEQMKEAILSHGRVENVRVVVADVAIQEAPEKRKISGINKLNNFEYREEGVLARQVCRIGTGSLITISGEYAGESRLKALWLN